MTIPYAGEEGMYCATCGRETASGGSFCQWCGTGLAVTPLHPLIRKDEGILTDEYAGIGRRFLAFIIDLLFILVLAKPLATWLATWL